MKAKLALIIVSFLLLGCSNKDASLPSEAELIEAAEDYLWEVKRLADAHSDLWDIETELNEEDHPGRVQMLAIRHNETKAEIAEMTAKCDRLKHAYNSLVKPYLNDQLTDVQFFQDGTPLPPYGLAVSQYRSEIITKAEGYPGMSDKSYSELRGCTLTQVMAMYRWLDEHAD